MERGLKLGPTAKSGYPTPKNLLDARDKTDVNGRMDLTVLRNGETRKPSLILVAQHKLS